MDMNCTRLDEWLTSEWLPDVPDTPALPPEWATHVAGCAPCSQRWQDELRLTAAIVAWRETPPRPPATSPLIAALLSEVAAKQPAVRKTMKTERRLSWWPLVAASAALVIAGIGLTRFTSTGNPSPWTTAAITPDDSQQLALTSTVGSLMNRFEGTPFDMLAAGQQNLPRLPGFQPSDAPPSPFAAGEIIDPAAPSAVLRYGQPLGQGVGEAFRFLQIAVPIPATEAG